MNPNEIDALNEQGFGHYFDREGRPIGLGTWLHLHAQREYLAVRQERAPNGAWISTVWLGLDHAFGGGPPLIFETMAWTAAGRELGGWRYSTEPEALAGHAAAVRQYGRGPRIKMRVLAKQRARDRELAERSRRRLESRPWYHRARAHSRWIERHPGGDAGGGHGP